MSGERRTDFEALDGLSAEDREDLQRWSAWRDPWPGHVRPCARELDEVDRIRATRQPVFPKRGLETAALYSLKFEDVRVVLLGIDPYPNAKHATGLAFSVPADVKRLPPGVHHLRKAVRTDYPIDDEPAPLNGDLSGWVGQGVLLLNRALTYSPDPTKTSKQNTGAHLYIWREWTDAVITALDEREQPPVFVLMGDPAKKVRPLIRHTEPIERYHPSAPGLQRSFWKSRLFRDINDRLGGDGIDWSL